MSLSLRPIHCKVGRTTRNTVSAFVSRKVLSLGREHVSRVRFQIWPAITVVQFDKEAQVIKMSWSTQNTQPLSGIPKWQVSIISQVWSTVKDRSQTSFRGAGVQTRLAHSKISAALRSISEFKIASGRVGWCWVLEVRKMSLANFIVTTTPCQDLRLGQGDFLLTCNWNSALVSANHSITICLSVFSNFGFISLAIEHQLSVACLPPPIQKTNHNWVSGLVLVSQCFWASETPNKALNHGVLRAV